jgi:hypothetical protein
MAVIQSGASSSLLTVDPVNNAAHVVIYDQFGNQVKADTDGNIKSVIRPTAFGALGAYSIAAKTGALVATIAANAPLLSVRWTDGTRLALIERLSISVITVGAITAAVTTDFDLIMARAFTAADSTGTALTLTTNNAKRRTNMGTTLMGEIRLAGTAALTAGTRTLDAQPMRITPACLTPLAAGAPWFMSVATAAITSGGPELDMMVWDAYLNNGFHPIILAQNEGVILRAASAGPATGTFTVKINMDWIEVAAY